MKACVILAVFAVICLHKWTLAGVCQNCQDTYDSTAKSCTDVKNLIKCLFEVKSSGDRCYEFPGIPYLRNADRDMKRISQCDMVGTCKCQLTKEATSVSSNPEQCSANLLELHCLADASGIGCDEVKTKVEILAIEEPETKGISGPCVVTTTCQCQVDRGKADMSPEQKKCDAYTAELACYISNPSSTMCNGDPFTTAVTTAQQRALALSSCLSETCNCHSSYYTKDISTDQLKCVAAALGKVCTSAVTAANDVSCDGTTSLATVDAMFSNILTTLSCSGSESNTIRFSVMAAVIMAILWTII